LIFNTVSEKTKQARRTAQ